MFFEGSYGSFRSIDTVVVWRDQLDGHFIGADVLLHRLGALVVHDVECWLVVSSPEDIEDLSEGSNEGGISA